MSGLVARMGGVLGALVAPFRSARGWVWTAVVVGIGLRVLDYGYARPAWKDEQYLRNNVAGRAPFAFDRPLTDEQLAPPGFLVLARAWAWATGGSLGALRALVLAFGIAALPLLVVVGRRVVAPGAVAVAAWQVALSDDLIYYATEFKQYSSDLVVALACTLLVWELDGTPATTRRLAAASLLGAGAVWLSHPSAFVLAAGGIWLAGRAMQRGDARRLGALALVGACWAASFAGCYTVSRRLLGGDAWMWLWWDFAFVQLPPRSIAQAEHLLWQLANLFVNPLGLVTPLGRLGSGLLGLGLFLAGGMALARRRRWDALALLVGPLLLTMLASALRLYPFHGRLLIFLVPGLALLVGEGVAACGRVLGRAGFVGLAALLFLVPACTAIDNIDHPRVRLGDLHGDYRRDLLDDRAEARQRSAADGKPGPIR
jgi:hypothetical protein